VNWLDFAIIVTILWFSIAGLSTGLLREVVTLLAAFVGVLLAGRLYPRLAEDIRLVHDDPLMAKLIAFIAIFGATLLAGQLVAGFLKGTASLLLLGSADRAAGLLFGFLKGCIVVEVVLIGFAVFPAAGWMTTAIDGSLLAPVFLSGVPWVLHLLPGSFRQGVRAF
jgi:membrane protein required for colicin V production